VTQSVGDVYGVLDYNGGTRSLEFEDLHAAMTAATRGNVSIYPIDPRGLSPGGDLGDESDPGGTGARELDRMAALRVMGTATGGFSVVNSNSFEAAFTRIVRENSTYYVLGFTSDRDDDDGQYRRLEVRVTRPGLQVRARDGYVAPKGSGPEPVARSASLSPAVGASLSLPIANPVVPMAVFAATYKGTGREASVAIAVEMDVSRLDLIRNRDSVDGEIEVVTGAISAAGKVAGGQHYRLRLTLKAETYERAEANGLRVLSEMALPPGRYQLRVVAGNTSSPEAGSVMYDLEVPDFTKGPLVMSDVSLTSASAAEAVTLIPKQPLREGPPVPPTASREFASGETLTVYAEVYDNLRNRSNDTVDLTAELRDDAGRVLQTVTENRSLSELRRAPDGRRFIAQLPLDGAPGLYVIHVEAQATDGEPRIVSRDIPIRLK
jgi:hypothetical protein